MMKDAVRRDMLLLIIGLSLIVAVFVFLVYLPGQRAEAAIQRELATAKDVIRKIPERVAELEALNREFELRREYLQSAEYVMPTESHLSSVLRRIAQQAERAELRVTRLEPLPTIGYASYECIPVRITIRGQFLQIADFLHGLEDSTRLFTVKEMRLDSTEWEVQGEIEGDVLFYVYAGKIDFSDFAEIDESPPRSAADEKMK